jgi:hypothetical protein
MIVNRYHLKSPVEIIETQLNIPQNYKQECIDELYRLGDSQEQVSNVKAIMTSWLIWNESNIFNNLLNNILITINKYDKNLDPKFKTILYEAWGIIYKKDHYSKLHNHGNSYLSFVYYLKSNKKTPLIFSDCNFALSPIDDNLIIFPSYLYHHVPPHEENEDRICIAGNVKTTIK